MARSSLMLSPSSASLLPLPSHSSPLPLQRMKEMKHRCGFWSMWTLFIVVLLLYVIRAVFPDGESAKFEQENEKNRADDTFIGEQQKEAKRGGKEGKEGAEGEGDRERNINPFIDLTRLVLVNGHTILPAQRTHLRLNVTSSSSWALLDYQRDQLPVFLRHIERGVKEAANDPLSLLLFSGGETRRSAGPISEAQSYYIAAEELGWFEEKIGLDWLSMSDKELQSMGRNDRTTGEKMKWNVRSRTSTEEHARDSYENLVFSLCRFHELTGTYPQHVTVIGFEFKRQRFENLHRRVVRYPSSRFTYIGIDPMPTSEVDITRLSDGEKHNSLVPFQSDPHGCHKSLREKRKQRNPLLRSIGYGHDSSCPQLSDLLHHCGELEYKGDLPWDA